MEKKSLEYRILGRGTRGHVRHSNYHTFIKHNESVERFLRQVEVKWSGMPKGVFQTAEQNQTSVKSPELN